MKALEKDRNRRYETANGLAMDLQRYLADEPVAACPPSVGYRLRKFVRRNKGPVLAASSVVLALVGGIIGTTWGMIRATERGCARRPGRSERDATDQLFLALLNQARAGRFSRQMGQRLDSLDALTQAARIRPDERLRDEAIAAMALPDVRRVPIRRSPALRHRRGGVRRAVPALRPRRHPGDHQHPQPPRRPGDPAHRLGPHPGVYLCFSPDDRFLLGRGEGHTLRVWRVADGQRVLRDDLRGCRAHAFSPDGRRLAVGQQEWVLCFDLATGQEVKRWRLPGAGHHAGVSPGRTANWPSGTTSPRSPPCTTRPAGPSSRTCPWVR